MYPSVYEVEQLARINREELLRYVQKKSLLRALKRAKDQKTPQEDTCCTVCEATRQPAGV